MQKYARRKALLENLPRGSETSLSMPIRMEQKRKRTRAGSTAIAVGVLLLGGAGYNAIRSGSELIAVYLAIVGIGLLAMGITLHAKASAMA